MTFFFRINAKSASEHVPFFQKSPELEVFPCVNRWTRSEGMWREIVVPCLAGTLHESAAWQRFGKLLFWNSAWRRKPGPDLLWGTPGLSEKGPWTGTNKKRNPFERVPGYLFHCKAVLLSKMWIPPWDAKLSISRRKARRWVYLCFSVFSSETVSFFLPFFLLAANTLRPLAEAMRSRKPCLFFLFLREGWYVRFIFCAFSLKN